jgi:hypothetical protein
MTQKHNFLAYQNYGMGYERQQTISFEDRDRYARAILTIAAADGLSPAERDYFVNLSRAMDMPDEVAEKYATYDTKSASLEELLAPLRGRHPVPYLLYDAMKIASVDGYTEQEQKRCEKQRSCSMCRSNTCKRWRVSSLVRTPHGKLAWPSSPQSRRPHPAEAQP